MLLQCAYAAVGGPGIIMHVLCFLAGLISTAAGLAAVGILWAIPKYNSAGEAARGQQACMHAALAVAPV